MGRVFRFVRKRRVERMLRVCGPFTAGISQEVWNVIEGEDPDIVFWDSLPLTDDANEN